MSASPRRVSLLVAILVLLVCSSAPVAAWQGTPAASPASVPASPVGEQLSWILDQMNGGANDLIEQDIIDRFHPEFLLTLPPMFLLGLLQETAAQFAPIEITGFAYPPLDTGAIATVSTATGMDAAITITVEAEDPHRITRLEFGEPPQAPAETGQRVDIGDRFIYINCTGEGSPTVILEGGISSDWSAVQPAISEQTRVCSYDRPDSPQSHSDPTPERTAQEVVDDLHAALATAGETGPYVLVGHSMGGLYVQLYAYQYPDAVAGLVLLDPTPETFESELRDLIASLGTPVPENTGPVTTQQVSFQQMSEARASGALPQVPLVLISHGVMPPPEERPPGWPTEEEEALFRQLHMEIVADRKSVV